MAINNGVRATILAGAFLASAFSPVTSHAAAPRVFCLQAFASEVPATKCDPATFEHTGPGAPDTITPLTDLYANPAFFGSVVVEGNATPGSNVTVVITDGTKSITRVATAAATPNPDANRRAGDFEILFDPRTDLGSTLLTVQELGVHAAAPGTDPSSTDPFDLGRSVLTVRATAELANMTSAPTSVEIVKLAATPNDTVAPRLQKLTFPPEHWCHYAGEGAKMPGINQHLGGGRDGTCSSFAQSGLGAIPDVTWVLCTRPTSTVPTQIPQLVAEVQRNIVSAFDAFCGFAMDCFGQQCTGFQGYSMCAPFCDEVCAQDFANEYSQLRAQYCRTGPDRSFPRQEAPLQGQAVDLHPGANGLASEIQSVRITIAQGANVVRSYVDAFARNTSTSAAWGISLDINDFAPTWPDGDPYQITITATDAWGNSTSTTSHEINVYPY